MNNSPNSSAIPSAVPNKETLYGEWLAANRWRDRLYRRASHKALDIPDDDDMIRVSNRSGFGWKELAVIAVAALAGWALLTDRRPDVPGVIPPISTEPAPAAAAPAGQTLQGRIRFWVDEDALKLDHQPSGS